MAIYGSTQMTSYAELAEYLSHGHALDRPAPSCKNTRIVRLGMDLDIIAVKLHATYILQFYSDGRIVLGNGGWYTQLTMRKMNTYLPAPWRLFTEKRIWYLSPYDGWDPKTSFSYANGTTIMPDGSVTGAMAPEERTAEIYLRKQVKKYSKAFAKAVIDKKVPLPGEGDCFFCTNRTQTGQVLGDAIQSDHLLSHMEENYFVSSMVMNALEEAGLGDLIHDTIVTAMMMASKQEVGERACLLNMFEKIAYEHLQKAIEKYVLRRVIH